MVRKILLILLAGFAVLHLYGQSASIVDKKDTVTTAIDSLLDYTYNVKDMILFVDKNKVDFSVVFDSETNKKRPQYRQMHAVLTPYDAIKQHGEKYRKGIIIYAEEKSE